MRISDIADSIDLKLVSGANGFSNEIKGAYVSDLLSDVMGNAGEGYIWITLQTHQNIIAVAALKDLAAVILVKGNMPDKDTIEKSNQEGIPVFSTQLDTFTVSGKLFNILKKA